MTIVSRLLPQRSLERSRRGRCRAMLPAALLVILVTATGPTTAEDRGEGGSSTTRLVYLRDADPSVMQDIRYATRSNFTGSQVAGYEAGECMLTRSTAEALRLVQTDLKKQDLSLKVYDCYRPKRAVHALVAWASAEVAVSSKRYHPNIKRSELVAKGYISDSSGHSRGDTVDLTMVALTPPPSPQTAPLESGTGSCTDDVSRREQDGSIDMGTSFDCFDRKSHTLAKGLTRKQREARSVLVSAMRRHGFRNYHKEWWHFTHGAGKGPSFDLPVAAKGRS